MAETIESFVAKLQSEGVQAGQEAAQKIKTEADQEAQSIIERAQSEAENIISEARKQAQDILEKGKSELKLATRDAALRLRHTLTQALQVVVAGSIEPNLNDPDFLSSLLHEIVQQYTRADSENIRQIKINLTPELHKQLAERTINELRKSVKQVDTPIDIKGTLARAGFEYKVTDATVEVTLDSVVEILTELVTPELRSLLYEVTHAKDN